MLLLGAVVCAFADIVSSENSFIGFHFPEDALGSNLTFGTVSFKQLIGQDVQINDFSFCLSLQFFFLTSQCILYSEGYFDFKIRKYDSRIGFLTIKDISFMFELPDEMDLTPRTWYRICVSYDAINNHKVVMTVDGEVLLDVEEPVLLAISTSWGTRQLLGNIYVGRCTDHDSRSFGGSMTNLNIWSRGLRLNEMQNLTFNCIHPQEADVLNWFKGKCTITNNKLPRRTTSCDQINPSDASKATVSPGVLQTLLDAKEACPERKYGANDELLVMPSALVFDEAKLTCSHFGGRLYFPNTTEDINLTFTKLLSITYKVRQQLWVSVKQLTNRKTGNYIWIDSETQTALSDLPWKRGQPNGKNYQQCANFQPRWKVFQLEDNECQLQLSSLCKVPKISPLYVLRGLCPNSNIDSKYMLRFLERNDTDVIPAFLQGFSNYIIQWNNSKSYWELINLMKNGSEHVAFLNSTELLPVGQADWYFSHDCSDLKNFNARTLKLTRCSSSQFSCNDGQCISMDARCNDIVDCYDSSDENGCSHLKIGGKRYRKNYPPKFRDGSKLNVEVSMNIISLHDIQDINMVFGATFRLRVVWLDPRLEYLNLKPVANFLDSEEKSLLWIPSIIFKNSRENTRSSLDEQTSVEIMLSNTSQHYTNPITELVETNTYRGSENKLKSTKDFDLSFFCDFNLAMYPFDTQICTITITLPNGMENYLNLTYGVIKHTGKEFLVQFHVLRIMNDYQFADNLTVSIVLQRVFFYHLAATYLPTSCLLLIAEITLFIDESHFDTTIMVALTSMLVMYTLYQSLTGSLPQTSYMKMIDIWLLFGLLLPFVVFLVEVVWELIKDRKIKNHGRERRSNNILSFSKLRLKHFAQISIPFVTFLFITIYWIYALAHYYLKN